MSTFAKLVRGRRVGTRGILRILVMHDVDETDLVTQNSLDINKEKP
jgi:hypothetical protein